MTDTTLVIADDHAVVRTGLRLILDAEEGLRVVAEAGNADDALRLTRAHRPAVLVLDLNMPGARTAFDTITELKESTPGTAVVVLTMQEDPAFAREALTSGAAGYVLKDAADAELVQAVRTAAAGGGGFGAKGRRRGRAGAGGAHRRRRRTVRGAQRRRRPRHGADRRRAARRPHRSRGGDPAAHRAWPHERRDRQGALPLGAH